MLNSIKAFPATKNSIQSIRYDHIFVLFKKFGRNHSTLNKNTNNQIGELNFIAVFDWSKTFSDSIHYTIWFFFCKTLRKLFVCSYNWYSTSIKCKTRANIKYIQMMENCSNINSIRIKWSVHGCVHESKKTMYVIQIFHLFKINNKKL